VFATQYDGYTDYEIALPDKYLKLANIDLDDTYPDPPYTADLYFDGKWVDEVLVREEGSTAPGSSPPVRNWAGVTRLQIYTTITPITSTSSTGGTWTS